MSSLARALHNNRLLADLGDEDLGEWLAVPVCAAIVFLGLVLENNNLQTGKSTLNSLQNKI